MSERPRDLKVRTYDYARSVIRVFRALPKDDVGRTLGHQFLRSGTSVGANYREASRTRCKLYANASNGECPIQIDTSTPSCGNSRFGCWTCTVVERDKASEGRLAASDEHMEKLVAFRGTQRAATAMLCESSV
jgi:hypothetical protein